MELSSLTHQAYLILESDKGYHFSTDQESTYWVYFTEADGFIPSASFAPNALTFGFQNQSKEEVLQKADPRIMATILLILYRFLSKYPEKIIFYICDDSGYVQKQRVKDGRLAKRRSQMFTKWFNEWQQTSEMPIEKIDNVLYGEPLMSPVYSGQTIRMKQK